jgi:hypothetical protein
VASKGRLRTLASALPRGWNKGLARRKRSRPTRRDGCPAPEALTQRSASSVKPLLIDFLHKDQLEIVVDCRAEDMCVSKACLVVPLAAVLGVGGERERQIYQLLAKGNAIGTSPTAWG